MTMTPGTATIGYHQTRDGGMFAFFHPNDADPELVKQVNHEFSLYLSYWQSDAIENGWRSYLNDVAEDIATMRSDEWEHHIQFLLENIYKTVAENLKAVEDDHLSSFILPKIKNCPKVYEDYSERFTGKIRTEIISLYLFYRVCTLKSNYEDPSETLERITPSVFIDWFEEFIDPTELTNDVIVLSAATITMRVVNFTVSDNTAGLPTAADVGISAKRISLGPTEWMLSPRFFGIAYDAQTHSSEWIINAESRDLELAQTPSFASGDASGNLEATFYIAGNGNESSVLDMPTHASPFGAEAANQILHRWGPIHTRLYFAITIYLTKTNGSKTELGEAELIKAVGLDSDVRNNNISRSEAIEVIESALNDLKKLHVSVRSSDGRYISGKFPVYQIEPLKIRHKSSMGYYSSLYVRFAPGLWAGDLFSARGATRALLVSPRVLSIPYKRYPLGSTIAIWISINSYLFVERNRITVGRILKSVLPEAIAHSSWRGQDITWRNLNPIGALSEEGKRNRVKIRRQFGHLPSLLSKYGISLELIGDGLKMQSSWSEFLDMEVEVKITKPVIKQRRKRAQMSPPQTDHDLIQLSELKANLKAVRLTQADVANHLRVSQSTVSNWLSGNKPMPAATKEAIVSLYGSKKKPKR